MTVNMGWEVDLDAQCRDCRHPFDTHDAGEYPIRRCTWQGCTCPRFWFSAKSKRWDRSHAPELVPAALRDRPAHHVVSERSLEALAAYRARKRSQGPSAR